MIPGYAGCEKCPLRDRPGTRPSGPTNASLVVIGEAPGQTEAKNGIPFVGPSGKLLRASLRSVGVDPDFVYITNTVACHPEENATPTAEAIACCHDRLVAEIEHVQPKKILLLGSTALSLLGPKQSVSRTRGLGHMYNGAFTIATYHPAAILRNPDLFRDFSHDLQKLVSRTRPQERLIPEYLIVEDKVQGSNLLDLMRSASVISCDLETTGTDSLHDKIIAIGFGISVEGYGEIGIIFPKEMVEVMKWSILTFLSNFEGKIVFHNIKFDMSFIRVWAEKIDFKLKHPVDSMLMVYAQDERGIPQEQKGQAYFTAGLKDQSRLRYDIPDYHWDFDEFYALPEDVRNWGQFYAYLAMDVICTLKLYWDLSAELDGESERLMPLVENLLTPGALAFSQIELRGFPIDRAYLEVLKVETEQQALAMVEELKVMAREASGGVINDFLPSSPKQVREMAKVWKFNPPSFEKDVLQVEIELGKWPDECKTFFSKLLEYRQISKVLQTYIVGILTRLGEDDRIHPDFQMHGTDTGRLSCRNPNLQNIPTIMGPKIKHAFIAPEGWKLFNCDYSQLELRVAAWFSRDDALMEAFRTGRDIHRWVASLMFKKPMDQITSFERYLAKYLDFGLLYGRSARGLLEGMEATYIIKTTGKAMTEKEADALQKDFFDAFPGLVKYINNQHRFVNANLFVESPTGRRRRFPFVDNRSRGSMERKSVNTPIQSFASDCTLTAIIRLVEILDPSYAYVVSSVHDSIMLLVRDDYVDAVKEVVHQVMSTPPIAGFDVPLKAEIAVGQRWSQMKD